MWQLMNVFMAVNVLGISLQGRTKMPELGLKFLPHFLNVNTSGVSTKPQGDGGKESPVGSNEATVFGWLRKGIGLLSRHSQMNPNLNTKISKL